MVIVGSNKIRNESARRLLDQMFDQHFTRTTLFQMQPTVYVFTRSEVLEERAYGKFNVARNITRLVSGASAGFGLAAFLEAVTIHFQSALLLEATSLALAVISTLCFSILLPKIKTRIWVPGINKLLSQVLLSHSVTVTAEELSRSTVVKSLGGGGEVIIRTKKRKGRLAAAHDFVGSIEVHYPNQHPEEFAALLESVVQKDPHAAKALAAAEKKQLKSAKK